MDPPPHRRQRVYQLRVQRRRISPPIWRRLLVPAEATIRGLHDTLQAAIDARRPLTTDLLELERSGLDPASLGLHLDEAKALLGRCQEVMASAQVRAFVEKAAICSDCGQALGRKGRHRLIYRTVFGKLELEILRFYPCRRCRGEHSSTSPLASCLPERSRPELQYLQTKFAALMSYELSVEVLSEVLPLADTLAAMRVIACIEEAEVIEKLLAPLEPKGGAFDASRRPPCRAPPRRSQFD